MGNFPLYDAFVCRVKTRDLLFHFSLQLTHRNVTEATPIRHNLRFQFREKWYKVWGSVQNPSWWGWWRVVETHEAFRGSDSRCLLQCCILSIGHKLQRLCPVAMAPWSSPGSPPNPSVWFPGFPINSLDSAQCQGGLNEQRGILLITAKNFD